MLFMKLFKFCLRVGLHDIVNKKMVECNVYWFVSLEVGSEFSDSS